MDFLFSSCMTSPLGEIHEYVCVSDTWWSSEEEEDRKVYRLCDCSRYSRFFHSDRCLECLHSETGSIIDAQDIKRKEVEAADDFSFDNQRTFSSLPRPNMNMEEKLHLSGACARNSLFSKTISFCTVTHTYTHTHTEICFISSEEIFSYDDALSNEKFSSFPHRKISFRNFGRVIFTNWRSVGDTTPQADPTPRIALIQWLNTNRVILKILL